MKTRNIAAQIKKTYDDYLASGDRSLAPYGINQKQLFIIASIVLVIGVPEVAYSIMCEQQIDDLCVLFLAIFGFAIIALIAFSPVLIVKFSLFIFNKIYVTIQKNKKQ